MQAHECESKTKFPPLFHSFEEFACPVECYGQGETQQISQRAQTDPSALLDYLDRFIDIRAESARDEELRKILLELQTKIEEAQRKVELIPQFERSLALAQSQIKA